MNVNVRMHQVDLVKALRTYLEKRLRYKLGRHADCIRGVRVHLNDQDGAADGTATVCFLAAELVPSGEVLVKEADTDVYGALGRRTP